MGQQLEKIYREFYEEGYEEGYKEAITKTLVKLVRSGKITAIEAAEELGVSVESFRGLMAGKA